MLYFYLGDTSCAAYRLILVRAIIVRSVSIYFFAASLGAVSSTIFLVVVFMLGFSWLTGLIVLSGTPTATFLFWVLPSGLLYSVLPEGGGPATILLFAFSAWLQFAILFSVIFYFLLRQRSNKALNPDARQEPRAG